MNECPNADSAKDMQMGNCELPEGRKSNDSDSRGAGVECSLSRQKKQREETLGPRNKQEKSEKRGISGPNGSV